MKNVFIPTLIVCLIGFILFGFFYTHADKSKMSRASQVVKNSVPARVNSPSCQLSEASAIQQGSGSQNSELETDIEKLATLRESAKTSINPVAEGLAMLLKKGTEAEQRLLLEKIFQGIRKTAAEATRKQLERPASSKEIFSQVVGCALLESLAEQGYLPPEPSVFDVFLDISESTNGAAEKSCACCAKGMKALRQKLQKAREAREAHGHQQKSENVRSSCIN